MSTPEGLVKKRIIAALPFVGFTVWNQYTGKVKGRYATVPSGTPDVLGYRHRDGRLLAIEVKGPGGKASEAQEAWLASAKACGVLCGVAWSVADAMRICGVEA
jgi:hypothetical protein